MSKVTPIDAAKGGRRKLTVFAGADLAVPPPGDDLRHTVIVTRGHIDLVADDAALGVFDAASTYFQRGDALVRLVQAGECAEQVRKREAPVLIGATAPMLLDDLEKSCRFVSRSVNQDNGEVRTRIVGCPKVLPSVLIGRAGRLNIPVVRGIAEVPLLHEDGTLVVSGYDARAGVVVVAPGVHLSQPNGPPSEADARAALARVDAVIACFPFVSDDDRAVTIAAFLSAVLRPTLPSCPAFAWSAPVRGTGKSKLADVAAVIATGRTAPALTWPAQEDEAEKRLAATVMAGDPVILLDNIETSLRGACLNSLLTQETVSMRVLGRSQIVRMGAAALVLATGNNLVLLGDLSRRFLVAHLDPATERPELRTFDFDPVAKAHTERRELVSALHTIARWGLGQPTGLAPLGSFETWSRRVRDPLVALGLPDCCKVLEQLHQADPEREAAIELLTEWRRVFARFPTTVADAIRRATNGESGLRDALDGVAGGPGGINAKRLGRYLLRHKDRVMGRHVLRQQRDLSTKLAAWSVDDRGSESGVSGLSGVTSIAKEKLDRKEIGGVTNTGKDENPGSASKGDDACPF